MQPNKGTGDVSYTSSFREPTVYTVLLRCLLPHISVSIRRSMHIIADRCTIELLIVVINEDSCCRAILSPQFVAKHALASKVYAY